MIRIYVLMVMLCLSGMNSYAQFSSEKDLVAKIKACSDDISLNMFLMRYDLIPKDSVNHFHKAEMKIDVFKKNLFGSTENEIVIQLRQPYTYAVSVYYYQDGAFKKVPGNLHCYFNGPGYIDQTYTFAFEPIYKANEYAIIATTLYSPGINRIISQHNGIYKITPTLLDVVYEYNPSYNYSPDPLSDDYSSTTKDTFLLVNNTYPKILVLDTHFESLKGTGIAVPEEGEEANGYTSSGWRIDTVYFLEDGTTRSVIKERTSLVQYVGEMNITKFRPAQQCYEDTVIYIAPGFAEFYLKNPDQLFAIADTNEIGYATCCAAYIQDNELHVITKKSATAKPVQSSFDIYPFISGLIKPSLRPKDVCYRISTKEVFISKEVSVRYRDRNDIICFDNMNYIYTLDVNAGKIIFKDRYNEYTIPYKAMEPYLKLEILEQFK